MVKKNRVLSACSGPLDSVPSTEAFKESNLPEGGTTEGVATSMRRVPHTVELLRGDSAAPENPRNPKCPCFRFVSFRFVWMPVAPS